MAKAVYGVYRGDEFITVGTAEELAKELNVKASTIKWHTTAAAKKRKSKKALDIFKIEG